MKPQRWIIATVISLSLTVIGTSAWAASAVGEGIAVKAARGLENTTLGLVTEWPKTMYYEGRKHGVAYGMTVGFAKGLAVGVARTGVGVYELATFPVPVPSGYQPILSPQFSLEPGETRVAR